MVWRYEPNIKRHIPQEMWGRYSQVFQNVWAASAYKGATGPAQYMTNVNRHRINHDSWIQLMRDVTQATTLKFKGIALTGWTRYDHFATLCELLPASIPSLVVCLQTVLQGKYTGQTLSRASKLLQCQGDVEVILPKSAKTPYHKCTFPGSELYDAVHSIRDLRYEVSKVMGDGNIHGWISSYQLKNKFASPARLYKFVGSNQELRAVHGKVVALINHLKTVMKDIFYEDAISEFIEEHVLQFSESIRKVMNGYHELVNIRHWSQRP